MSQLHLPVVYRLSPWYWVVNFIAWIAYTGATLASEEPVMAVIFLVPLVFGILFGLRARLIVTSEGFRYVWDIFNWFAFQAFWHQVRSVELYRYQTFRGDGSERHLNFYLSNHNEPKRIYVGWYFLSKSDLREFIRILKIKAPQAGIDPKLLEYLR